MKLCIFTLCDHANTYGDKFYVIGSTDVIKVMKFPVVIKATIAVKLHWEPEDEGLRTVRTAILDLDGKPIARPPSATTDIKFTKDLKATSRLKVHYHTDQLHNLTIPKPGEYVLELYIDEKPVASLQMLAFRPHPLR